MHTLLLALLIYIPIIYAAASTRDIQPLKYHNQPLYAELLQDTAFKLGTGKLSTQELSHRLSQLQTLDSAVYTFKESTTLVDLFYNAANKTLKSLYAQKLQKKALESSTIHMPGLAATDLYSLVCDSSHVRQEQFAVLKQFGADPESTTQISLIYQYRDPESGLSSKPFVFTRENTGSIKTRSSRRKQFACSVLTPGKKIDPNNPYNVNYYALLHDLYSKIEDNALTHDELVDALVKLQPVEEHVTPIPNSAAWINTLTKAPDYDLQRYFSILSGLAQKQPKKHIKGLVATDILRRLRLNFLNDETLIDTCRHFHADCNGSRRICLILQETDQVKNLFDVPFVITGENVKSPDRIYLETPD